MRSDTVVWVAAGAAVIAFGSLLTFGSGGATAVVIAILGWFLISYLASTMARDVDRNWLRRWVAIGFIAKLAGTFARFYMVTEIYGVGDSFRYYRVGTELAQAWRSGNIPELTGRGGFGTQVTEWITGVVFAVITPDMLGGFVIFSVVAFIGQMLLYVAFRRFAKPDQLKPYAVLIFLLPTYAFWPSSIGKDALVLLGLGATAYFAARSLQAFEIRWLFGLGTSLAFLGVIRIHIAGLVVASFILASLFSRVERRNDPTAALRRLMVLAAGVAAAMLFLSVFPDIFGVDLTSTQDRDGFTADVFRRTSESGTVASGEAFTSILDLPGAVGHVLYRPMIYEATELQHLLAAGETLFLVLLSLWKLPAMVRNLGKWRSNAYLVFSTFYLLGFAVAFSVVRNLGIIARQRGQVLAFFLVIIVALGWETKEKRQPRQFRQPENLDRLEATTSEKQ